MDYQPSVVVLLCFFTLRTVQTASFYGDSFISLPFQDDSDSTQLQLRFRTTLSDGLLFLASGTTDYLSVILKDGRIKVDVDVGSGVISLQSIKNSNLNDKNWHQIKFQQRGLIFTVNIDNDETIRAKTTGSLTQLNIQNGIYLGGIPSGATNPTGFTLKPFRGCLQNVLYNQYNVINLAHKLKDSESIKHVSWNCEDEFGADVSDEISFLTDTSYAALPPLNIRSMGAFTMELKTFQKNSLLFFTLGDTKENPHAIAIELINGKLRLSVNRGGSTLSINSQISINDGSWHLIQAVFSDNSFMFGVDRNRQQSRYGSSSDRFFTLSGLVFIGGSVGLDPSSSVAKVLNLQSFHNSFKGCVRNILIDNKASGFPDIVHSNGLKIGCTIQNSCLYNPCNEKENCVDTESGYDCICTSSDCLEVSEEAPHGKDRNENGGDVQLVRISPLLAREGEEVIVTTDNIDVIFDFRRYGIRESAIQFYVLEKPKLGSFRISLGRRRNSDVFTLLDLIGKKVSYTHNGIEEFSDSVSIEMLIIGNDETIPERLTHKHAFVLPIIVSPVNDPPIIKVLPQIEMAKLSAIEMSSDILSVIDPDSEPKDIEFITSCESKNFFQQKDNPGQSITRFSQEEMINGTIEFVDKTGSLTNCELKANDLGETSNTVTMAFRPVNLYLSLTYTARIRVATGAYIIIKKENLNVNTNVEFQKLTIEYTITYPTVFGAIEKLQPNGEWTSVTKFTQKDINEKRIRYRHTNMSYRATIDQVSFVISSLKTKLQQQTVPIDIIPLSIHVDTPKTVQVDGSSGYFILRKDNLEGKTNNDEQLPADIKFQIIRPPARGRLYHLASNLYSDSMFSDERILDKNGVFSQLNINDGLIAYKVLGKTFDIIHDFVDFMIQVTDAQSKLFRLRLEILPKQTNVKFINNPMIDIYEGGQKAIEKDLLYLETTDFKEFKYTVTNFPQHGNLLVVDPRSMAVLQRNISVFTNDDIRMLRIIYEHDDSENSVDSFQFIAVPSDQESRKSGEKPVQYSGTFHINIKMRNDHYPVRVVDKVFHIVADQDRVITLNDLEFKDPDKDFNAMDLVYSQRGVPNGDFIFTQNKSTVYQFEQRDIAEGKISFKHQGPGLHSRAVIWVTDGQFYTTSMFEIQASNPYIKILNNTGIFVNSGKTAVISHKNLSVETNIDMKPLDIRFVVTEEPYNGKLEIENREVTQFTYQDILDKRVYFKHNGRSGTDDSFHFIVQARNVQVKDIFLLKVITANHQHPPRVISNNLLEVQELGIVAISKAHLEISHPDISATGIKYTIQKQPKHGRLYLDDHQGKSVLHFTQEDINKGSLKYYHTQAGPLSDFFTFDVTNGMQTLQNLEFVLEIIPTYLELDIQNLTVSEGGKVPLTPNHLKIKNRYYLGKPVRYDILRQPGNGLIESIRQRGDPVTSFTSNALQNGEIFYVHDNGELSNDNFILKAVVPDENKESRMTTMNVFIRSVNDKPPILVINKKLTLWKRSMGLITASHLKSSDPDSPPEMIKYTITQPTNGHVAFMNNTFRSISTFTQASIDAGQVVFVHQGSDNGEFNFHVSDGANSDGRLHRFYISAQQLFVTLIRNSVLKVYPGRMQAITQDHLFAKTNDPDQRRPIIYNIFSKPQKGRIITQYNGRPLELQSFKQEDIEQGLIFYDHTNDDTEWDEMDAFTFEVSCMYAEPVTNQIFKIDISYTNLDSGVDGNFNNRGKLSVKEGGNVTLTRNNIDVTDYVRKLQSVGQPIDIIFIVVAPPRHGKLVLKKLRREVKSGQSFQQADVNSGDVIYQHDGSETTDDRFSIKLEISESLRLKIDKKIDAVLNFSVVITPVNDEKFRLITSNPRLYVIQGLAVDITQNDLNTEDLDTPADRIIYEITILPRNGIIAFKDSPLQLINRFSQKDINDGKLQFKHDGKNPSTTFHFRVSDGHFPALSRSCYITVIPISLERVHDYPVQLMQADTAVDITSHNIAVKTNGLPNNVYYNISKAPRFGAIYSGNSIVLSFKQTDIDDEKISYIQHDLSTYRDYFTCDVFYPGVDPIPVIHNQQINIHVEPLIVQNPFSVPMGETLAITTKYLDASKLANLSGHLPQFRISEVPKYGRILGTRRSKRSANRSSQYVDITEFSHRDIVDGDVFYSIPNIPFKEGLSDSFGFILAAEGVQPAAGQFSIKLAPPKGFTTPTVTHRNDNDTIVNRSPVVEPDKKSNFVIILAILIPLFILLIIVILIIYFIWRKRCHQEYSPPSNDSKRLRPSISGPIALDQPHVRIEPQQDVMQFSDDDLSLADEHPNYYNIPPPRSNKNDEYRLITHSSGKSEVGSKVPQCKVTLLADSIDNESTSRMSGYSVRSDTSTELFEWSSLMDPDILQHCRTTNPVLRDNQYWV